MITEKNENIKFEKLNKNNKIICINLLNFTSYDNIQFIDHFDKYQHINKKFTCIVNKYESSITKFYKDNSCYKLSNDGILSITDFLMLIKDSKCVPFWNDKCKILSEQIFLPTNDNITTNETPNTFNYKNWFDTEHKISITQNKTLEIDKIRYFNEQTNIKSHKIKIYFNEIQKQYIKRLYGVYRYFYNRTINFINNYDKNTLKTYYFIDVKDNNTKIEINLENIVSRFTFFTIRKLIKYNYPQWMQQIKFPSHLIDLSIKEATIAYKSNLEKFKKYKIPFKLTLKTKKDKIQTLNLEKKMISTKKNGLFIMLKDDTNQFIFRNLKTSCKFNKYKNICDSSISWNIRTNEFFMNLNFIDDKHINENILLNKKICSIDPGLKTFLTIYDDNSINKIGIGIRNKINKICEEIDIITSKINKKVNKKYKYNHNKRRNLRKALHRKIKYLNNIREELHNKSIKYLCDNYGKIIIPPFETQKMVKNNLNSKLSRNLMSIAYYKFLTKLKSRCVEYDIELVIRPEYYTSKTCGCCGNIKTNLSNNDVYKCNQCNLIIDRDSNGARNILLRNLEN